MGTIEQIADSYVAVGCCIMAWVGFVVLPRRTAFIVIFLQCCCFDVFFDIWDAFEEIVQ